MQGAAGNKNKDQYILRSLIDDIKRPLVLITRQVELEQTRPNKENLISIQETAQRTLKLLDSYLLASQSEYGQQVLPIKSFGLGSIIHSVAEEMRPLAKKSNVEIVLDVNDALVSANPEGLKTVIWCLSDMALTQTVAGQNKGTMQIAAKRFSNNIHVSVLSNSFKIKNSDIYKAKNRLGNSHMALSSISSDSGIRLAIASLLSESMGLKLKASRAKNSTGIGFNISLSRQLQLI